MSQVTENWKNYKLYELCDFKKGSGLSKNKMVDKGTYRCILYGELFTTYSEEITQIQSHTNVQEGVLSKSGDVLIPASTTTSAIDLAIASVLNHDNVLLGGDINILRKKTDLYDPFFLALLLRYHETIKLSRFAQGSTIIHLYGRHFKTLEIIIPDIPHQKKITEILSTIDQAITHTKALIGKNQRIKIGMMQDLLTRGIDENGEIRDPATHKFKPSLVGMIPEEWDVYSLGCISKRITSGSRGWAKYYSEDGSIFIRIGNLTREHVNLDLDDIQYVNAPSNSEAKRTQLEYGDLLISITADLGIIGVVPEIFGDAYINQHIALVKLDINQANPWWVGNFLTGHSAQKYISMLNDAGAKAGLNLPTIAALPIPVPRESEQTKITELISKMDQNISIQNNMRIKLKRLKSGLMQDLLSGKVSIAPLLDQGD